MITQSLLVYLFWRLLGPDAAMAAGTICALSWLPRIGLWAVEAAAKAAKEAGQ